ncbi:MAG: hypothetical protein GY772_30205, partial [bacterium]|nr:hypothetical protein [bacterium]
QRAWLDAAAFEQVEVSMGAAGVLAAAPAAQAATEAIRSVSVVEAHPPALGWHDDMNFPELNRQPVPEDLASSPADWVSDAESDAALHVPPAASASGAPPEPAAASSTAAASSRRVTPEPAASSSNVAASSSAAMLEPAPGSREGATHDRFRWADSEEKEALVDWGEPPTDRTSPTGSDADRPTEEGQQASSQLPVCLPKETTLERLTSITSLGWDAAFCDHVRIPLLQIWPLVDLVTAEFGIEGVDGVEELFLNALVRAHAEVCADGPLFIELEHVCDVVAACRYTLRNLVRGRRDVLLEEQRRRELPDEALQDVVVEDVDVHMKEHRRAFEKSHAQVC